MWSIQQLRPWEGEAYPANLFAGEAEAREVWAVLARWLPGNTRILRDPAGRTVDTHRARLGS